MTPWILLAISLVLIALCGIFVASEFAFVTVDRTTVDRVAATGDQKVIGVQHALRSLSTQLSGAQIGITVTNLAVGYLAEPAIAALIGDPLRVAGVPEGAVRPIALAVALVLSTVLTMVFGEMVPKNLAIARPLETARHTQRFMRAFTVINHYPIKFLNGSANAIVRRLGLEPQEELRSARSSDELASLVQHSADRGTLDAETAELVERSVEFGQRSAGEIMTPRVRTTSLSDTDRASTVIEVARQTGLSRFPVLDSEDVVVGVVHVKNVVALPVHERATTRVRRVMGKATVVPDSLRLDPLLALLRNDGSQMAVVLDEYGGHAGIVTLEDVVEEIVGDISDEHDRLGARHRLRPDGSWYLSGLLRPDEVEDITGLSLPLHEDYDTIGGLIMRELGKVPGNGDRIEVVAADEKDEEQHLVTLTVARMDGLRVDRVHMRDITRAGEPPVAPGRPGRPAPEGGSR